MLIEKITEKKISNGVENKDWQIIKKSIRALPAQEQLLFQQYGFGKNCKLSHECIHHAFEKHVHSMPHALAAIHSHQQISYLALDQQANKLAQTLSAMGVSKGDHVGIFLQRSIHMLIAMLATLKLGAVYIPQHAGVAPRKQLTHIIKHASIKVALTLSHLRHHLPNIESCNYIELDKQIKSFKASAEPVAFQPRTKAKAQDHCLTIFTSGTTGQPNGVQVTHANLCNVLLTSPGNLGIVPGCRVSQILSIAFDMSVWEIWGCLANGGTLLIRDNNIQQTVAAANVVIATPSILSKLDPTKCSQIKTAAVAGEPCPKPLADSWSSVCTFYNACGPTETTIINTAQCYKPHAAALTIGKPTPNNSVYILDEFLRPSRIGEVGEMWAGGRCVTEGYLKNPKLNAQRYVTDPFLGTPYKMFRTRDLGQWTENGELLHLGRTDDQVKICGFRVELDSVSTILESVPSCSQAVTLKYDNRSLVAFVRPGKVDIKNAKEIVASSLPYYCVPVLIIAMDVFPMTSRGKVDRNTLMQHAKAKLSQKQTKQLEVM